MKNKVFTEPVLKNTETLGFFEQFCSPEDISANGHLIDYLFQLHYDIEFNFLYLSVYWTFWVFISLPSKETPETLLHLRQ